VGRSGRPGRFVGRHRRERVGLTRRGEGASPDGCWRPLSGCRGDGPFPARPYGSCRTGSAAASHVDEPTLGFPLPHECRSDAGAAPAPADASISSDGTVIDTGDETPASVETVDPGARLLGGPRRALPHSAVDAALPPGPAPSGPAVNETVTRGNVIGWPRAQGRLTATTAALPR
jgi:hypothetical protein